MIGNPFLGGMAELARLVFAGGGAAALCPGFANAGALRAGAAAVDITPVEFPLNMPGGFSANLAESAHDPLHARALVLDDGATRVALVVVDSLGAGPEVLDEAKGIAAEATGMPVSNMLVCSTHTHSGPPSGSRDASGPAAAYRKRFVAGVADSIIQAHAALRPAAAGHSAHPLPDEVFNRRWFLREGAMPPNPFQRFDRVKTNPGAGSDALDRPAGPIDPDITILSVQNDRRQPLALWANYALHYVGGIPRGQISADYFGEFARLLPSRLRAPDGFVGMMSNGASGDINNIPFNVVRPPREPFEQVRIVAQKAADTAWHAWKQIGGHDREVVLGMREREVTLRYRRPGGEEIAQAEAVLAIKDKAAVEKLPRLAQNYARNTLRARDREEESLTVKIQAVRVGDLLICGLPFEVFVEIGLELKERSPFARTMVVGMAKGRHGYLPTPEHHKLGGYETWLGTCYVEEQASVILTKNMLELAEELRSGD
jgi:neutral ceramidase